MRRLAVVMTAVLVLGAISLAAWPFVDDLRTDRTTAAAQARLRGELPERPAGPAGRTRARVAGPAGAASVGAASVGAGEALGTLRVPRFGEDWSWVVVEGTGPDQLELGPGHYSGTPLPGARGNVALAGHRAGYGDPFLDFEALRVGDRLEFEQAGTTWRYAITREPEIIPTSARWVLDPLPGRQLTLTTCWPRYGSSKRMYVRAELIGTSGAAPSSGDGSQVTAHGPQRAG